MINCLLINKSTLVQLTQLKLKFIKEIRYKLWVISENAYKMPTVKFKIIMQTENIFS